MYPIKMNKMQNREYNQALKAGNVKALEILAEEAGYNQLFHPLFTRMMQSRSPEHARDKNIEWDVESSQNYFFHQHFDNLVMHPFSSAIKLIFGRKDSTLSPREDWNEKYHDIFTRVKTTNKGIYFVDCWKPKNGYNKGKTFLTNGKFLENWIGFGFRKGPGITPKKMDEETTKVLNLVNNRRLCPPLSRINILLGPTPDWILGRGLCDLYLFVVGYSSYQIGFGQHTQELLGGYSPGVYFGLGLGLAFETYFHNLIYQKIGNGLFKKQEIKFGKNAIISLIEEKNSDHDGLTELVNINGIYQVPDANKG